MSQALYRREILEPVQLLVLMCVLLMMMVMVVWLLLLLVLVVRILVFALGFFEFRRYRRFDISLALSCVPVTFGSRFCGGILLLNRVTVELRGR